MSTAPRMGQAPRTGEAPIWLEAVPALLASGRLPIDVALLQVPLPDARGCVSLGVSVALAPAVLRIARHVIAGGARRSGQTAIVDVPEARQLVRKITRKATN